MRLLLKITLFCLLLTPSFALPQLTWDTKEAQLTLGPKDKEAQATFTATNTGDEAFRIADLKTSCGCTGAYAKTQIVEPGETTEIVITFSKGKRSGKNRNKVKVYLDGVDEPVATLSIVVDIPTLIELKPRIVFWNQNAPKAPQTIQVSLNETYGLAIDQITYDAELFTVTRIDSPSSPNMLTLEVTPKSYDQTIRSTLTLTANGKDDITAEARAHIFVQP